MSPARRRRTSGRGQGTVRLVAALLLVFFAAVVVIWRRAQGHALEHRLTALDTHLLDRVGRRDALRQELRQLGAEDRIREVAGRRLGMRRPSESQLVDLPVRPASGIGSAAGATDDGAATAPPAAPGAP